MQQCRGRRREWGAGVPGGTSLTGKEGGPDPFSRCSTVLPWPCGNSHLFPQSMQRSVGVRVGPRVGAQGLFPVLRNRSWQCSGDYMQCQGSHLGWLQAQQAPTPCTVSLPIPTMPARKSKLSERVRDTSGWAPAQSWGGRVRDTVLEAPHPGCV